MKTKYPVEAFALAIILMSATLKEALVAGILVFLAASAGVVIKLAMGKGEEKDIVSGCVAAVVGAAAFYAAFVVVLGAEATWQTLASYAFIGLLAGKFVYEDTICNEVSAFSKESIIAYIMMLIIACVREFWGAGALLGSELIKANFTTSSISSAMFGLIFAGLALGFTNMIVKKEASFNSLFVVVPAAIVVIPVNINSAPAAVNVILGAALAAIIMLAFKNRLTFSVTKKAFRSLPVELVCAGIAFMVMSVI